MENFNLILYHLFSIPNKFYIMYSFHSICYNVCSEFNGKLRCSSTNVGLRCDAQIWQFPIMIQCTVLEETPFNSHFSFAFHAIWVHCVFVSCHKNMGQCVFQELTHEVLCQKIIHNLKWAFHNFQLGHKILGMRFLFQLARESWTR